MGDKTPQSRTSKRSSPADTSRQEDRDASAAREDSDDSPEDRPDPVEEASMDSFPASDPPSYEPLRAGDPNEEPKPEKGGKRDP